MDKKIKRTQDRKFLSSFFIAGFQYYDGSTAFSELQIGTQLVLQAAPENIHDEFAVEVYYGEESGVWYQLGYIPKGENREISLYLQSGWNPYIVEVQRLQPEKHPQQQVEVGIFLSRAPEK